MKTILLPGALVPLLLVFLPHDASGSNVVFTNDAVISSGNTNYDGRHIVISNCTVTINGSHSFAGLHLLEGGALTHPFAGDGTITETILISGESIVLSNTTPVLLRHADIITNTIVVADPVRDIVYIESVDYEVFVSAEGDIEIARTAESNIPDEGTVLLSYEIALSVDVRLALSIAEDVIVESGASINLDGRGLAGGMGLGAGSSRAVTVPYAYTGGAGGGHGGAGGTSASGAAGGSAYGSTITPGTFGSGGGAGSAHGGSGGGAISIEVGGALRIDGRITANGSPGVNAHSGGGAGGSIRLSAQTIAGTGSISASGGQGEPANGGGGGGGRIAIVYQSNQFSGNITARGGRGATHGGAGTIYLRSSASSAGLLTIDNGGSRGAHTLLSIAEGFDLTIGAGAVVHAVPANISVGNLVIHSNAWLTATTNQWLQFTVNGNATIHAGGGIDLDGKGFPAGQGSGFGRSYSTSGGQVGGGAGHGGTGGNAVVLLAAGGNSYGSIVQPIDRGSGGGNGSGVSPLNLGGTGGGALRLNVAGTLILHGAITANGVAGVGTGSGGGSGGSLWLSAGRLAGAGVIAANGGAGDLPNGGGGAGGRVAIHYGTNEFYGTVIAQGSAGATRGGAGTIYSRPTSGAVAEVIVANSGAGTNTVLPQITGMFDLVVSGGAVVIPYFGSTLRSLLITSNSWLTYHSNLNLTLTVSGSAEIQPGGGIDLDGRGYGGGQGPGAGQTGYSYIGYGGSGASHGGLGGASSGTAAVSTYSGGSVSQPAERGSGGGMGSSGGTGSTLGGSGGGALRLDVLGTLTLGGSIRANGTTGPGLGSGGGAGGSIWLTVGRLLGAGVISANGGAADLPHGGGGGGGRIALYYSTNLFIGSVTAYGGAGLNYGGAGTVYRKATTAQYAEITVRNVQAGANTILPASFQQSASDLIVSGGAVAVPASGSYFRTLVVASNSWMRFPVLNQSLTLTVLSSAVIEATGGIDLDGGGFTGGQGPGSGGTMSSAYGNTGGGGGHGGRGAASITGAPGGNSYGVISGPIDRGSGGGAGAGTSPNNLGGHGGGAVRLSVSGTLTLEGRVSADGVIGAGSGSGGGSGGSIWLNVGKLSGGGVISANGGSGRLPYGGGGAGGRIAVAYGTNEFFGSINARGAPGASMGGAGTIYLKANSSNVPQIIVNNGGSGELTALPVVDVSPFDLTVTGGSAVIPSSSAFIRNLVIGPDSWITGHSNQNLTLTVTSNATIYADGGIDLDGKGFPAAQGTGLGRSYSYLGMNVGGGGGHGAYGGDSAANMLSGGIYYGSLTQPSDRGSGGGNGMGSSPFNLAGSGGGALRMEVAGTLLLNGLIRANGTTGPGQASGGGAGGSIWLTTGRLAGSGMISADGGSGHLPYGGGGAGGRIAFYYATNDFIGKVTAHGGNGAQRGGAGTIYSKANSSFAARLVVENAGSGTNTVLTTLSTPIDLTIAGGAVVIPISSQAPLGTLVIGSNSWLTFHTNQNLTLVASNAIIQAGGGIDLRGKGHPSSQGPGFGRSGLSSAGYAGSGAGHGGSGGDSFERAAVGGSSYGSLTAPIDRGSGGGSGSGSPPFNSGGGGGGVLRLDVTRTLHVDGIISVEGIPGPGHGSGGGSGGSLWLAAGRLTGSGVLSANGGSGDLPYGGGGGGGRIAIYYITNQFAGTVTAHGGAGATHGGAGTIYLRDNARTSFPAKVIVENADRGANTVLPAFPGSFDLRVSGGAVVVSSAGSAMLSQLLISSNSWLTYTNLKILTLTVLSNAVIEHGGGIDLDGKGWDGGTGSGAGGQTNVSPFGLTGGGGGHGGLGGGSIANAKGGGAYGVILQPSGSGSGGGNGTGVGSAAFGGSGGGALRLSVSGRLLNDGRISANGTSGPGIGSGGGAGGSIWVTAGRFSGTGVILANGGAGRLPYGGGGGGGRIAINYSTNEFFGNIEAHGGAGFVVGGAGTIYHKRTGAAIGDLLVDNRGLHGTNTPLSTPEAFTARISGGAVVHPSTNSLTFSNLFLGSYGTLTHSSTQTNLDLIILGDATIERDGMISVDAKGYGGTNAGPGSGEMFSSGSGSGGGHGGIGGASASGVTGGLAYGSAVRPVERGSKGGVFPADANFSAGGGAVRLRVGGRLLMNGRITADGEPALLEGSGGGAGGSIWITAPRLAGSGIITAHGGEGEPVQGGGGSGGRIAIYSKTNTFVGTVSAAGAEGASWGEDGTIFFCTNLLAPEVISQSPAGAVASVVSFVELKFSFSIDPISVSAADVAITTPEGPLAQSNLTVTVLDDVLRVAFPEQNSLGTYEVQVGPSIDDICGSAMPTGFTGSFTIVPLTISGKVSETNGLPLSDVLVQPSGGLAAALTDTNGAYVLEVPPGWSGAVTPSSNELIFAPARRDYISVAANLDGQDYVVLPPEALMLANQRRGAELSLAWSGIGGVVYQPLYSTNLVDWLPYGEALTGSNGTMGITVPISAEHQGFFRLDIK